MVTLIINRASVAIAPPGGAPPRHPGVGSGGCIQPPDLAFTTRIRHASYGRKIPRKALRVRCEGGAVGRCREEPM